MGGGRTSKDRGEDDNNGEEDEGDEERMGHLLESEDNVIRASQTW